MSASPATSACCRRATPTATRRQAVCRSSRLLCRPSADSDLTLTPYGQVNPWYAATITDTAQLYQMDGVSVYAGEPVQGQSLVACDSYNHCTTASAQMLAAGEPEPVGGEVLFPSATTVLTSTEPITVSGDAYAETGLKTLTVEVAGATAYTEHWETADVYSTAWSFPWTPPGEGIFVFTPHIDHWAGDQPAVVADAPQVAPVQHVQWPMPTRSRAPISPSTSICRWSPTTPTQARCNRPMARPP